jgi:hypothetical protein
MKKLIVILGVVFLCGVISASTNISVEPLFNLLRDSTTNSVKSINYGHAKIHGGSSYHAHIENTCTNTGEMTAISFATPNTTKWIHLVAVGSVNSIARLTIGENPTITADAGTQFTVLNRDRNDSSTSGVLSIEGTPVANKVTTYNETQAATAGLGCPVTLDTITIGAAGANPALTGIGGQARGESEWILKQNEQYVFMIKSLDDSDNVHTIELNWYEHTNR